LLSALRNKNVDVAKFLLERGANLNARDTYNRDGFWHAVACGDKSFVETLITQVQDINVTGFNGFNYLHNVARRRPHDTVDKMPEDEITEIALLLIRSGAVVSTNQPSNISPLHCACQSGNVSLIKKLLEMLPPEVINVESKYFGTPLYTATFFGREDAVKLLLETGADINLGMEGESPLEAAGEKEALEILKKHRELMIKEEKPA
jgi:ankyrin repeat protein